MSSKHFAEDSNSSTAKHFATVSANARREPRNIQRSKGVNITKERNILTADALSDVVREGPP